MLIVLQYLDELHSISWDNLGMLSGILLAYNRLGVMIPAALRGVTSE